MNTPDNAERKALRQVWNGMIQRCYNQNTGAYRAYGGRGITVCDRWRNDFEAFVTDMGPRPQGTMIDRINVDGNYTPDNCRWATRKESARNTRRTRRVMVNGQLVPLLDIAERNGLDRRTVYWRIYKLGWPDEEAVELVPPRDPNAKPPPYEKRKPHVPPPPTPPERRRGPYRTYSVGINRMTMTAAAKALGITKQAISSRIKAGWPIEKAFTLPAQPGVKP